MYLLNGDQIITSERKCHLSVCKERNMQASEVTCDAVWLIREVNEKLKVFDISD